LWFDEVEGLAVDLDEALAAVASVSPPLFFYACCAKAGVVNVRFTVCYRCEKI
jgi:hypothetical protein